VINLEIEVSDGRGGRVAQSEHDSGTLAVELEGIEKRFRTQVAVQPLDLTIHAGEFLTLLGPSGCGKTTLLRMIAGLEIPSAGTVRVFGQDVTDKPANKRPVNLVFQRATLFPHLSVAENIAFGPRLRHANREQLTSKVESLLELVQLPGYGTRRINELSGGQAQRIAFVRALANDPKVLLLDEPLSALDLAIRRQLQRELKEIHRRLGMTFVYVTHDQEEAFSMSDRVAVMRDGAIEQIGSPVDIYRRPATSFVARFIGHTNVLSGTVRSLSGGVATVEADSLSLRLEAAELTLGADVVIVVRPDSIEVNPVEDPTARTAAAAATQNVVIGTVIDSRFAGAVIHYSVEVANAHWQASVPASQRAAFATGEQVALCFGPSAVVVLSGG